jgi:hypothetical protein
MFLFIGDISSTIENTAPGSGAFMRAPKAIARAIQRKRAALKGYPKKPKTYDEMVNIPDHLMETSDKSPFLILNDTVVPNNSTPNAKRLLVYMSTVGRHPGQLHPLVL